MIRDTLLLIIISFLLFGCGNSNKAHSTKDEGITANQQKLLDEGWFSTNENKSRDISSEYGITPIYGIHDNYFDIKMGVGSNLALKIIDLSKNKCIRYIYVQENSEFTISQIPQGKYKLLIAYGTNWMTLQRSNGNVGKFADNVYYEQSVDVFDFGKKNSKDVVNYLLTINVDIHENLHATNFHAEEISEEEFYEIN
jgi:hypothetical protein